MPILELFPKPAQTSAQNGDPADSRDTSGVLPPPASRAGQAKATAPESGASPVRTATRIKVRTGRYGELEEHELIHLLDSIDDERARARFRESIYISVIVYLAIAWFLFYGPRVLWHQPVLRDPIALMKQHDKELTYITPTAPAPRPPRPVIDRSTLQKLKEQARALPAPAPPTPQPPAPQPSQPQEEAHVTAPPVPQPPAPLPPAPKAAQPMIEAPLPAAPRPSFAQNSGSVGDAIRQAAQNARGRSGADIRAPGASGPLQAGATILTDTQGVDFSSYLRRLHDDIQRNWDPLIPEEVEPPLLKKGAVGIRFIILSDGQIGDIKLETPSGDVALDKAAWYAITSEGQFPPLPRQFHGPQIELRVGFFYNEPIQQ